MSEASGMLKVTYENPNHSSDKIYFRLHEAGDNPQCRIHDVTDADSNVLSISPYAEYAGIIEVKLKRAMKVKEKINLVLRFSTPVSHRSYYVFACLTDDWHPRAVPYHQGKLRPWVREFASYQVEIEGTHAYRTLPKIR